MPRSCARRTRPASPASVAPIRNARILIGPVRMPIARAASSSSRIAIQARPIRRVLEVREHRHDRARRSARSGSSTGHRRAAPDPPIVIGSLNARAEQRHRRDARDRVRATGQAADVVLRGAVEDLTEGQRHDRQVVAAHPQRRRADDRAEACPPRAAEITMASGNGSVPIRLSTRPRRTGSPRRTRRCRGTPRTRGRAGRRGRPRCSARSRWPRTRRCWPRPVIQYWCPRR